MDIDDEVTIGQLAKDSPIVRYIFNRKWIDVGAGSVLPEAFLPRTIEEGLSVSVAHGLSEEQIRLLGERVAHAGERSRVLRGWGQFAHGQIPQPLQLNIDNLGVPRHGLLMGWTIQSQNRLAAILAEVSRPLGHGAAGASQTS